MQLRICIFILVQCQDGWYGEDCISTCGHCNGSESCDKEDGQCSTCEDGYRGTLCIEGAEDSSQNSSK